MGKSSFEIIAGSYEEFLLGYNFSSKDCELTQSFAAHDHAASVRCVALSGHYLASGGADDRIFIYDLKSRKEHCSLTYHNATVNCLQFTDNHTHLISGSSDGVLAVVRVGNWQVEKIWDKAHKGAAVLDIAVHSSGKLALTLGSDQTLCTWNLVKGRQAYVINLKSKCKDARSVERISWASDGVRFVLYGGRYTEIWSIETGGVLKQIEHEEKVTSCVWSEDSLLVGHENGQITLLDTEDGSKKLIQAHGSRVKAIALYRKWIISVSSNGDIVVWNKDFEELAKVETGCRLTCLCVVPPIKVKTEKTADDEDTIAENYTENVKQKKIRKSQVVEIIEETEDDVNIVESGSKKKKRNSDTQVVEKQPKKKKKKKKVNQTVD